MSWRKLVELSCDNCNHVYVALVEAQSVSIARRSMRYQGWTFGQTHGDLCSACSEEEQT